MEKAATGIKELDKILSGGIPRGSSTLLEGPPGGGKSIFAIQFIQAGLDKKEGCLYICVDDPPEVARQRFRDFGKDPEKYEEAGLLAFADCFSWRIGGSKERYVVMNNMSYDGIAEVIREARNGLKKTDEQRSVIDSMTSLLPQLTMQDSLRLLSWLKARSAEQHQKSSMWLAHRTSMDEKQYSILLDNVGGIIELRFRDEPEALLRELRVTAMPFAAPTPRWIPYDIKEKGIKLSH